MKGSERMSLKIMLDDRGRMRATWYARLTRKGKKVNVNLRVPIRGSVPLDAYGRYDRRAKGDAAFEASRAAALAALEKLDKEANTTGDPKAVKVAKAAAHAADYFRACTGVSVKTPPLSKLGEIWEHGMMRAYTPTAARVLAAKATLRRFAEFTKDYCAKHGGVCDRVGDITTEIAAAYFQHIFSQYAWDTVKGQMSLLSGVYAFVMGVKSRKVDGAIQCAQNPFSAIIKRNRETANARISRKPLTEAELARLFEVTEENPGIHNLVVCAACTGMRIGDVCNLKWSDVDLTGGFIECVTAKAGVRVTLPIFAPLRRVLDTLAEKHALGDSPFVFPYDAERYNHINARGLPDRRTGIIRGVKPYFARAVFDTDTEPETAELTDTRPLAPEEVGRLIDAAPFLPAKKERLHEVYERFRAGANGKTIAGDMGLAKGQISAYLRELETLTGEKYRPSSLKPAQRSTQLSLIQRTRVARKVGKFSASVYGWHSLRHTFVVLALQNGVPAADVKTIVGHSDVETTLGNYNNPTKAVVAERVRRQLAGTVLGGESRSRVGETIDAPDAVPTALTATPTAAGAASRPGRSRNAERALALARAVLDPTEAAQVDAVFAAAGVDPAADPERALTLIGAVVGEQTKTRIAAVVRAAGL